MPNEDCRPTTNCTVMMAMWRIVKCFFYQQLKFGYIKEELHGVCLE